MNGETDKAENLHRPVMAAEVLGYLRPEQGEIFVDATIGLGGHAEAILSSYAGPRLIGIDRDPSAIEMAVGRLKKFGRRASAIQGNFSDIAKILEREGVSEVDGIVADLGVSSMQLDSRERGFSFRFDAPLDMRMDPGSEEPTAADLLASASEGEIADILFHYGDERFARRIARRIVERREAGEAVTTTYELARLVERSVKRSRKSRIHPATRTFQALRIAVNRETEVLGQFIDDCISVLAAGGRLVIISFHSIEDRIVKQTFQKAAGKCSCPPKFPQCVCGMTKQVKILTRKPVLPTESEQLENPRARSAKLRACQKSA